MQTVIEIVFLQIQTQYIRGANEITYYKSMRPNENELVRCIDFAFLAGAIPIVGI